MSDKLKTDSIDFIATKQDFIELMDENVRLQKELETTVQRCIDAAKQVIENKFMGEAFTVNEFISEYKKTLEAQK